MIQFNLLPDVKTAYIKAKRAKRIVILASGAAILASFALLAISFSIVGLQKKHISDLNKDITASQTKLKNIKDLSKILTIQNQLDNLPALYAQRPLTSRLFQYIEATTPKQVSTTQVSLVLKDSTLEMSGNADSLESVNKYIDTLKFTTYKVNQSTDTTNAFTNVVLKTFNRDAKTASYVITMNYSPALFDPAFKITFDVPKTITTRSETQLPGLSGGVFDTKGTE